MKNTFDPEIKKGIADAAAKKQQPGGKSSTNAAPTGKPPASGNKFNRAPAATPASPPTQPVDTMQAMQDAGMAHINAIHAHVNSLKGG